MTYSTFPSEGGLAGDPTYVIVPGAHGGHPTEVGGHPAPNPVQPGVLTIPNTTPQEGADMPMSVDFTAAELADGFTTTDAVFVLNGVDQGSGTDNMDGTWDFTVDPVTLANANGTWRVRRETAEGNRLSNAVVVTVSVVGNQVIAGSGNNVIAGAGNNVVANAA